MENRDIIRAVVCMLGVDGAYDPREMAFLNRLCARLDLPRKCVIDAFKGMRDGSTAIKIPKSPEDRSRILDYLIDAALSDGELAEAEKKVLEAAAVKMGMDMAEITRRIDDRLRPEPDPAFDLDRVTADDLLTGGGTPSSQKVLATCPGCGYEAHEPDDRLVKGPHGPGECPFCGVVVGKRRASDEA